MPEKARLPTPADEQLNTFRLRLTDSLPRESRFETALDLAHLLCGESVGFQTRARGGCVFVFGPWDEPAREAMRSLGERSNANYEWLP